MKKITIEIETKNTAFGDYPEIEIARILQKIVDKLEDGPDLNNYPLPLPLDINRNPVGKITIT